MCRRIIEAEYGHSNLMKKHEYIIDVSTGIEVVSMENVSTSFPPHTHTGHYVFGIVTEGCIAIKIGDEVRQCRDGEYFSIYPDVCHSIEPVTSSACKNAIVVLFFVTFFLTAERIVRILTL